VRCATVLTTFLAAVLPLGCGGSPSLAPGGSSTTQVTLSLDKTEVVAGETALATATVTTNNNPVASHVVTFTPTPMAGSLSRPPPTDGLGETTSTFTAGVVAVDTPVEVEARAANGSTDTKTITVKPPIVFDDYGDGSGSSVAPEDVSIAPSVTKTATCEYAYTYSMTSPNGVQMEKVSVNFAVPMTVSAPTGATTGVISVMSLNGDRVWIFALSGLQKLTITGTCSDCEPGGSASWTVIKLGASNPPVAREIANLSSTGPMACQ